MRDSVAFYFFLKKSSYKSWSLWYSPQSFYREITSMYNFLVSAGLVRTRERNENENEKNYSRINTINSDVL